MKATLEAVAEAFGFRRLVAVLAVMADKDVDGMLELLEPAIDELVITQNSQERTSTPTSSPRPRCPCSGADRVTVEPRLDDAIEAAGPSR